MWWSCEKFVCVCCSYPGRQALWRCRRHRFSVGALGRAQLGRHGGRFIYVGQRLGAVLRLAVLCAVPLVPICVVVEVWRWKPKEAEKEMKRKLLVLQYRSKKIKNHDCKHSSLLSGQLFKATFLHQSAIGSWKHPEKQSRAEKLSRTATPAWSSSAELLRRRVTAWEVGSYSCGTKSLLEVDQDQDKGFA